MTENNNPNISLVLKFIAVVVIVSGLAAVSADVVTVDGINIEPDGPTDIDLVEITTHGWIGYALYIDFLYSDSYISETSIDLDFYFYDSNPYGIKLPVAVEWDSTVNIGTLSAGAYDVSSKAWVIEDLICPEPRLADTYSTSFTVVPEPAMLLLLGLGTVILRRKQ